MIGPSFADTEARVERVLDFIRDAVAEAHVSEPAGLGAGWAVEYDEAAIRSFIMEVMVGVALPSSPPDLGGYRCDGKYRLPPENPAEVIGYCWEVNAAHVNAGRGLEVGMQGPLHRLSPLVERRPGFTQVWIMRNGQEVRATWKRQP